LIDASCPLDLLTMAYINHAHPAFLLHLLDFIHNIPMGHKCTVETMFVIFGVVVYNAVTVRVTFDVDVDI